MTFLNFEIDEKDLAAAKFIGETRRGLVAALIEAKKDNPEICQAEVARLLGMDKGSLSKILNGHGNMTLRKIGEIAWALGLEPRVEYCPMATCVSDGNHIHRPISSVETSSHSKGARISGFWSEARRQDSRAKVKSSPQNLRLSNAG